MTETNDTIQGRGIASPERAKNVRRVLARIPDFVRVEANIDQHPIWAPSIYADERTRTYPIRWKSPDALVTVQASGEYGMLRSFDKLVLTALVHLWNQQDRNETGRVYFRIIEIIEALGRTDDGKTYEQVKQSLHRLRGCMIQYQSSFRDPDTCEYVSIRDKNILSDLLIVEPRKEGSGSVQMAFDGLTYAQFDFQVVANLLGNFTRPVSIRLLQDLSERGVLFESYVNAVLYRHAKVAKDVFELWHDLGLSTKGVTYGSQLAAKMRADLDKLTSDNSCPLARYTFEKSKTRARSQTLNLYRSTKAVITAPSPKYQTPTDQRERYEVGKSADLDKLVEWMKLELHDESPNDTNLRVIAGKMPEPLIRRTIDEAYGRYRDGLANNPAAYFVAIMKREAAERGIDLGLPERDPSKPLPKRVSVRKGTTPTGDLADMTAQLAERFKTGRTE
ncbi:MAG: replication initiator protein A [Myxococcota bacterium]